MPFKKPLKGNWETDIRISGNQWLDWSGFGATGKPSLPKDWKASFDTNVHGFLHHQALIPGSEGGRRRAYSECSLH